MKVSQRIVCTAFLVRDGRILLLRRSQKVGSFRGCWAGVSGTVDHADEDILQAARREIMEEVGYGAHDLRLGSLSTDPFIVADPGRPHVSYKVHTSSWLLASSAPPTLNWENDAYTWVTPEQALARMVDVATQEGHLTGVGSLSEGCAKGGVQDLGRLVTVPLLAKGLSQVYPPPRDVALSLAQVQREDRTSGAAQMALRVADAAASGLFTPAPPTPRSCQPSSPPLPPSSSPSFQPGADAAMAMPGAAGGRGDCATAGGGVVAIVPEVHPIKAQKRDQGGAGATSAGMGGRDDGAASGDAGAKDTAAARMGGEGMGVVGLGAERMSGQVGGGKVGQQEDGGVTAPAQVSYGQVASRQVDASKDPDKEVAAALARGDPPPPLSWWQLYVDLMAVAWARPGMAAPFNVCARLVAPTARVPMSAGGMSSLSAPMGREQMDEWTQRAQDVRVELTNTTNEVARLGGSLLASARIVATLSYSSSVQASFRVLASSWSKMAAEPGGTAAGSAAVAPTTAGAPHGLQGKVAGPSAGSSQAMPTTTTAPSTMGVSEPMVEGEGSLESEEGLAGSSQPAAPAMPPPPLGPRVLVASSHPGGEGKRTRDGLAAMGYDVARVRQVADFAFLSELSQFPRMPLSPTRRTGRPAVEELSTSSLPEQVVGGMRPLYGKGSVEEEGGEVSSMPYVLSGERTPLVRDRTSSPGVRAEGGDRAGVAGMETGPALGAGAEPLVISHSGLGAQGAREIPAASSVGDTVGEITVMGPAGASSREATEAGRGEGGRIGAQVAGGVLGGEGSAGGGIQVGLGDLRALRGLGGPLAAFMPAALARGPAEACLLSSEHLLLLGADCVFVDGQHKVTAIANKIGSLAAAMVACASGVPVVVLADTFKELRLPELWEAESACGDADGEAPCALFERVPGCYISVVLSERGDWPLSHVMDTG
eukprot:jgi/Mesvir1/22720/Mv14128-RA.1